MILTPVQVVALAALGGYLAMLSLLITITLALGIHRLVKHTVDAYEELRERRRRRREQHEQDKHVADYRRRLDTLPTTPHPAEGHQP